MRSSHSPTIRSRYDYYYSSLSPASSAANFYDNQNQSLFGDPVPPVTDFIETLDNHLYGSFRRGSTLSPTTCSNDAFIEDFLAAQNKAHRLNMSAKRKNSQLAASPIPNDSMFQRNDEYRFSGKRRSSTSFSDELRANLDTFGSENDLLIPTAPKRLFSEEPINYRNIISMQSSDSQNGSSNEWIRPTIAAYPRPASRNIMQIDHSSGMTSTLPESRTPSSDGTISKPSSFNNNNNNNNNNNVRQIQVLPYGNKTTTKSNSSQSNRQRISNTEFIDSSSEDCMMGSASPPRRDISPAILTDKIHTGSDFRFQPSRAHKKTSFTIINELEPNQSRPGSPSGGRSSPFRGKGFRANSSKRYPRTTSCPETPQNTSHIDSSQMSHDDIQIHRPSVHFNVIPPIPRKRTAIQVLDATTIDGNEGAIIDVSYQDRDMESFEMLSNVRLRSGRSVNRRSSIRNLKPSPAPRQSIQRSASNLNKIGNECVSYATPTVNPRSFQKGLLGVVNTSSSSNLSPSRIPRRKSSASTPSLIVDPYQSSPRHLHHHHQYPYQRSASSSRKNSLITSSTDRLNVRRDSSAYSGRRSMNNDLGGSMIDLGVTPSSSRSMNRISKPTTLSPIVGTPNKDCECDSNSSCRHHTEHYRMDGNDRRYNNDTMTKIPIRRSSSVSLNTNRTSSRSNSRDTSPPKSNRSSPTKIPQKVNQKTPSPSKVAKKNHIANSTTTTTPTTTTTTTTTEHTTKAGTSSTVNKEQSSAKKEPAINHEKSSVKKPPAGTTKPESSTLKRQPSNVKRENSQQKLKRENSTIGTKQTVKPTAIRKEPTLLKNQSDSSLAKRLEKKNSFKQKRRTSSESDGLNEIGKIKAADDLTALTKKLTNGSHLNGVSMTTAAVAAQPIQITTAVTDHLSKTMSSGQIIIINDVSNGGSDGNNNTVTATNNMNASAKTDDAKTEATTTTTPTIITTPTITEPNQKAENVAIKTAATITEPMVLSNESSDTASKANGTNEMHAPVKGDSMAVLQKKASTRTLKNDGLGTPIIIESGQKAMDNATIDSPIETNVNVIDNVLGDGVNGTDRMLLKSDDNGDEMHSGMSTQPMASHSVPMVYGDGQDNGDINTHEDPNGAKPENGSENGDAEDDQTTCCKLCKCCTPCYASALCLPCRRLKKSSSCCTSRTKKAADDKKATEIATSILNENEKATVMEAKQSCWKRMNCCKRKQHQVEEKIMDEMTAIEQQATQTAQSATDAVQKERGKCALCLTKVFCCRKTNQVQNRIEHEMIVEDGEQKTGCCSCLPCRRKKSEPMAWNDGRQDSLASIQSLSKKSCCARLCEKIMCCKRKEVAESRRTSMNSKKQSIAPTLPPEDTRPKIDESLVDRVSVMKGAIPVLPVGLAWFCLICNCLIPGFGTIWSGLFCLCLGIPRFSQHDGVRARIGSFFVNTFVGIAQAFTLIFCLVGWGWSIWWGMIMLRTAKKHRKLLQASDDDLEEAQTITSQSTSNQAILSQAHRDIEAGRHRN